MEDRLREHKLKREIVENKLREERLLVRVRKEVSDRERNVLAIGLGNKTH